jgi:RNA polymerase sigma-70 factor (ECF subfamily)
MDAVATNIANRGDVTIETLESLRWGEEWAFNEVYARYATPICDFLTKLIHDRESARELCHDIFEEVWMERHRIDPAKGIKRLLYIKARNRAMDYFDHEKVKRRYAEFCNRNADHGVYLDGQVDGRQAHAVLELYLGSLSGQREAIFRLRYESGLTVDEIASRLGLSVSTVKNNLSIITSGLKAIL